MREQVGGKRLITLCLKLIGQRMGAGVCFVFFHLPTQPCLEMSCSTTKYATQLLLKYLASWLGTRYFRGLPSWPSATVDINQMCIQMHIQIPIHSCIQMPIGMPIHSYCGSVLELFLNHRTPLSGSYVSRSYITASVAP